MKRIINKSIILIIALFFALSAISACNSTDKTTVENKGSAGGTEQSSTNDKTTAENKSAQNKAANEDSAKTNPDGLPELKKGEDYVKVVSEKMLKAGWQHARSADADWCGSAETTCDEFKEYESKTDDDLTNFRWKKGNKFVEISCAGEGPYTFESYKIENNGVTIAQTERWEKFWKEFKTAIDKKDKEKLTYLMTENIDGGGDVETRAQRIAAIEKSNMWSSLQKTVAEGTKADKCDKPCRVSKDGYLVFTYDTASWRWSGLGGEGGGI